MKFTDPDQLSVGTVLYEVCHFVSNSCSLHLHEIISFQKDDFIEVTGIAINPTVADYFQLNVNNNQWDHILWLNSGTSQRKSLHDMGIISNTYNKHNTFDSLGEAMAYGESQFGIMTLPHIVPEPTPNRHADYDHAMNIF